MTLRAFGGYDGAPMGDFDLVSGWVQWLRAQSFSPATVRLYSYGIFRFFTEEERRPEDVSERDITAFLAGIGKHSTARAQYFRGLRSFFGYCLRHGVVSADPTAGIRLRPPKRKPAVALTEDELIRILIAAATRNPRRAWTLMLAYSIGTRRSELAGIEPGDVQGELVHLRHCKGGKERWVELCDLAKIAIRELRPWSNGTLIGGLHPQTITLWAHEAAEDAGLLPKVRHRTAHVLRASFATHLLRRGVPIEVVRDLMGHENLSTTNTYAAVEPSERADAVRQLDRKRGESR